MEILLTTDQLAKVASYQTRIKQLELECSIEKQLQNSFILGISTSNKVEGDFKYEIKDGKLVIIENDNSGTA